MTLAEEDRIRKEGILRSKVDRLRDMADGARMDLYLIGMGNSIEDQILRGYENVLNNKVNKIKTKCVGDRYYFIGARAANDDATLLGVC